ncbi:MAG: peptidoglycan editing factor PgeF [Clostridia bacterium]|nr:peptidoglycan editing factor PgeF [Clostridia bacterium]
MFVYRENGGVGYYYSTLLVSLHGFSTRKGGVSALAETAGLNLAFGRGDDKASVLENLRLFASALGIEPDSVISLPQVHGNDVLHVSEADAGRGYAKEANGTGDGYVTRDTGVTLGVKSADCVPVLLEARDEKGHVLAVSAVHAGWRGTAGGIVPNAVKALRRLCGDADVYAAIGPCIGACCFEVDRDCVDVFAHNLGKELVQKCFTQAENGKYFGDLTRVNRLLLESAGVPDSHIDAANICTCCHPEAFFSHRYAIKHTNGQRGTMLSVIRMPKERC